MPKISAIIITKNEAAEIADCLASVAFCDERVVVDSGSTDATVPLAEAAGARVVQQAWLGFGPQKNFALAQATGDWVLSVDADERVPPELAAEILAAVQEGDADGYEMPRITHFLDRPIYHSGTYPDFLLRLFRRGRARFSDRPLHEKVLCDGPVRRLKAPLMHYSLPSLHDAMLRADRYSTAGAGMLQERGRQVWFVTGIVRGLAAFLRTYVLRRGFLDGPEGFLLAVYNAETTFYRFMKAWESQRRR